MVVEVAADPKLAAVRDRLPAVHRMIYCNTGTNGPLPLAALDAIMATVRQEVEEGRIGAAVYQGLQDRKTALRALIAELFGAAPAEIALTHSTTEGVGAVVGGFNWARGDEIVTTTLEHPGVLAPLALVAHRHGVVVRYADIGDGGGDVVAQLAAMITGRTRMITLSHVMWSTGAVMPLADLAALARARDVFLVVDAAQGAGQVPVDLHASGVDAYALSGQKWLCGPDGTGALYLRSDRLPDVQPSYLRSAQIDHAGFLLPTAGAARFEIGELNSAALAGQAAALLWLRDEVGFEWAFARNAALGQRCWAELSKIPGVSVVTPRHRMAGLVCFTVAGVAPPDVSAKLAEQGITIRYVVYPPGPSVARASCSWWNTEAEIDQLVAGVAAIASAAPDSAA